MPSHGDTVDKDTIFKNYKSVFSRQFGVSLVVEFIGVMFFQIIGGTSAPSMAPFVNGFALAVWIYVAANISGGHLNPAVSLSTAICGFYPLVHTCLYILLQICGAILGALVTSALVPGADAKVGSGLTGPGCFDRSVIHTSLTDGQVFGWECVMTFTLISTVYACGVAKPGHGSFTPFAVGLSLLCCAGSGGQYTGAALNPARVLGPTAVFKCGEDVAYLYVLGEFTAAILAMSVFACVSGLGPLNPLKSKTVLDLTWSEAVFLWLFGAPPSRFMKTGRENIADLQDHFEKHAAEKSDAPFEPRSHHRAVEKFFGIKPKASGDDAAAEPTLSA
eukprot:CAMPEP_0181445200 /NCGR_PEP_ID=MMETSP1110-20121109/25464_1 /TAXON_ID=174948 /ORGANISM="Symbiodinium sp., Strain CCMP421" /LENGTH=332 /DNA_ID=CAMNT_0023569235 /DNA_START=64 /DNA_END=1062 /DNA_ORIENTATION=-